MLIAHLTFTGAERRQSFSLASQPSACWPGCCWIRRAAIPEHMAHALGFRRADLRDADGGA